MNNPFDSGWVEEAELRALGFKQVGTNVKVARNCTIIGIGNIAFGNHVRVDGYTTIIATGEACVTFGSYIHVAAGCHLAGAHGIELHDFSGLSQGVKIYSATDDYGGQFMTNPMVPARYRGGASGKVTLGRHAIIGSGSVILPGAQIGEGSSVGALSLVTKSLDPWGVYFGCPARRLMERSKKLLELEQEFLRETGN